MAAHPRVIQLDAGALAISLPPSSRPFKALAPDVVAAANEGMWAVLTEDGRTTAATWRGVVTLLRRTDDAETILRAGDPQPVIAPRMERLRRALARALPRP